MARASLRDDLAMEQASLTEDVLTLRTADTDPPEKLVAAWAEGWDTTQSRSAAQLADIPRGTGTSSPSCWSPSARCAACASAARPAASPAPSSSPCSSVYEPGPSVADGPDRMTRCVWAL